MTSPSSDTTAASLSAPQRLPQLYRALFAGINSGFCIVEVDLNSPSPHGATRIDYRVVDANAAFYEQTGFPQAIFGQWLRIAAPALEEEWFQIYGKVARTGEPAQFEQGSDLLGRWFSVYAFSVGEPEEHLVAILFSDITLRRRAELQLRELNDTLEMQVAARSAERDQLWTLSQDMLARADFNGMMSAVSPAWTPVLGWSEGELLTRRYETFMHPEDAPQTLAAIEQMARTRQPSRFENRIATTTGDWKHIEWTVAPEADGVNFIAVGRDMSLVKAREAELQQAQEQLRQSQKLEAMGQLTGGVAHDFNNLLTPIIGSLDMLLRRGIGSERERRLMDGALQSAERAKTLVQRLLAFARRQPLQPVSVDIGNLVEGMIGLLASTLGPTVEVRLQRKAGLPPAKADPNQLEMALLNLAVNARDAMSGGGQLTLGVDERHVKDHDGPGLPRGRYVALSVTDNGSGMDEATLSRAVEPFFSTKGIGKGTGLGLSMVHGLAAQLGGGLTIESKPAVGTTVRLWLPVSSDAVASDNATAAPSGMRPGRGTVLLVDDEALVRMSTADMLVELGFEVIEAGSAEEALKLIRSDQKHDLIVTDHLMPGMTGVELALASKSINPDVPVLLVSGYAEVDGVAPELPRLTKPFRNSDLAQTLGEIMPGAWREHTTE